MVSSQWQMCSPILSCILREVLHQEPKERDCCSPQRTLYLACHRFLLCPPPFQCEACRWQGHERMLCPLMKELNEWKCWKRKCSCPTVTKQASLSVSRGRGVGASKVRHIPMKCTCKRARKRFGRGWTIGVCTRKVLGWPTTAR